MLCQGGLTDDNKRSTLVGDVDHGEAVRVCGQEVVGDSVLSPQFCGEPKIALKNKVLNECTDIHIY